MPGRGLMGVVIVVAPDGGVGIPAVVWGMGSGVPGSGVVGEGILPDGRLLVGDGLVVTKGGGDGKVSEVDSPGVSEGLRDTDGSLLLGASTVARLAVCCSSS